MTAARLLAAPVLIAMVAAWGPTWAAVAVAAVFMCTDGVDGWIARRQGTTTSGAFLDPLADKAVVLGALCAVAARGEIGWVPVILIGGREVSMQLYRSVLARREVSVPARPSAKVKTVVQDIAVGLFLLPLRGLGLHGGGPTRWLGAAPGHLTLAVGVWVAAAFTLWSGAQYLVDGRRAGYGRGSLSPGGEKKGSELE